jgi:copper chaperone
VFIIIGDCVISPSPRPSPLKGEGACEERGFTGKETLKGKHIHMPTIKIEGMSCNHCVMAVTKALCGIDGVSNVKVDLAKGEATFDETTPVDRNVIGERIRKAGFEVA